jgi:endo-1,4-beta-xylanase
MASLSGWFDYYHSVNRYHYTFSLPDGGFDGALGFARANGMQTNAFIFSYGGNDATWLLQGNYSRDVYLQILREHVRTVVSHGHGQVMTWYVVNEAIADDYVGLRDTFWLKTLGPSYIELAFRWAHEYDPQVRLFMTDNAGGELITAKTNFFYSYVADMVERGIPVDGVGFQGHIVPGSDWDSGAQARPDLPPGDIWQPQEIALRMQQFEALGLEVWITEMDVSIKFDKGSWEERLAEQANIYAEMMQICLNAANCTALNLWGVSDRYSWLPLVTGSPDSPCLFDENMKPKPAYFALMDVLFNK